MGKESDQLTTKSYTGPCRQTDLLDNQSSETVSDENDFGRQRLLVHLDQQTFFYLKTQAITYKLWTALHVQ